MKKFSNCHCAGPEGSPNLMYNFPNQISLVNSYSGILKKGRGEWRHNLNGTIFPGPGILVFPLALDAEQSL